MATQNITSFKEEGKIYIVIENPSRETEKTIDKIFGTMAVSLAGIFKPTEPADTKAEAEAIDKKAPAPEKEKPEEPEKKPEPETAGASDKAGPEAKKPKKDITRLTPDEAKGYLTSFLKAYEKNPELIFKPADILTALFILRNRLDGVKEIQQMGPAKAKDVWIKKEMIKQVIHYTGYDWKGDKIAANDGWV